MDDAGGGRRGRRPLWSADVDDVLRSSWGLWPVGENADLGGSTSLNLLVTDGSAHFVARIHRPSVTPARLGAIQDVRRYLHQRGVPCTEPVPTLGGEPFAAHEGRLVEAEPFIDAPVRMNTLDRVSSGLLTLGRIHADLLALAVNSAAAEATFANYVPAARLRDLVRAGSDRVRSWQPTPDEARLADEADELAERVAGLGAAVPVEHVQLVHGDFWDNNVLLRDGDVALVTDFDFLGRRPRVDDLALTLYFASVDLEDLTTSRSMLATMVEQLRDRPRRAFERK